MSIVTLLQQAGTLYPKTGYTKYGRDQSGSGTAVKCRFQNKTKTKILPDKQVIQIVAEAYFDGKVNINTGDRFVINNNSYKVFSVNGNVDARGIQRLIKCELEVWQTT